MDQYFFYYQHPKLPPKKPKFYSSSGVKNNGSTYPIDVPITKICNILLIISNNSFFKFSNDKNLKGILT